MKRLAQTSARIQRQQLGAATLIVVMVLFLIMAMMAAFANRNLVFEQKIGSNYYRAGLALEVAEAGVEWTLAMLNSGTVDAACQPAAGGPNSFRQRYLNIDSTNRDIAPAYDSTAMVDCVRNNAAGWVCQCPVPVLPATPAPVLPATPALPETGRMQPRFSTTLLRPMAPPVPAPPGFVSRPGVIRIVSWGCTDSGSVNCNATGQYARDAALGMSNLVVDVALLSALKMPPATPLTVTGALTLGANGLGLHNAELRSNGLLLVSGSDPLAANLPEDRLESLPGTPGAKALLMDSTLQNKPGVNLFRQFFGMGMNDYQNQPAMRVITCPPGDCGPTLVAEFNKGVRMAWVAGALTINSNITLGTPASPLLLVANGTVALNGPMQLNGLLFSNGNLAWANTSAMPATLTGALIVAGNLTIAGTVDLAYSAAVMDQLSNSTGSFVRIPGGWWN